MNAAAAAAAAAHNTDEDEHTSNSIKRISRHLPQSYKDILSQHYHRISHNFNYSNVQGLAKAAGWQKLNIRLKQSRSKNSGPIMSRASLKKCQLLATFGSENVLMMTQLKVHKTTKTSQHVCLSVEVEGMKEPQI